MQAHELKPDKGATHRKMRVGRGQGSGKGTYAGRGGKGQTARTGGNRRIGFSGGQTTIMMRMPKLGGFKNPTRVEYTSVNVGRLTKYFVAGETVDKESLLKKRLFRSVNGPIKVLGTGDLSIALTVKVDAVSISAQKKIEKASGTVELLSEASKK